MMEGRDVHRGVSDGGGECPSISTSCKVSDLNISKKSYISESESVPPCSWELSRSGVPFLLRRCSLRRTRMAMRRHFTDLSAAG